MHRQYPINKRELAHSAEREKIIQWPVCDGSVEGKKGEMYDVDFGHQSLETGKYDVKTTYKEFPGYRPGVAVIGDLIAGIGNSDGNTNVLFHRKETLDGLFGRLERKGMTANRFRADCRSCPEEIEEEDGKR